jgi:tetratricopeptide (TPR) repeat protein
MKTLYDLLGVRSDANAEAVKKAFRRAVKAHHPDLNADEDAAERFREIIAANGILRDIEQRAAYDRHLELERQRLWLEWKRAVVQCLIAAAVSSAAVVGASTFFVALPTAATVHGKTEEAARRSTDLTAVRLAASDGSNAQDETVDKHENTKAASTAIETSVAPPATIIGTDHPITPDKPVKFAVLDAKFYRERAIAAYRKGDFDGAIARFDEAIRLDPNDAQAYGKRGKAWEDKGDHDRALADYDQAIRIDPNNPEAFHDRGLLWGLKGVLDSALVDLDRAIRFTFADASIYNDRGLVWCQKGRYDRALADFNQAIKINPNFAVAYINRGMTLQRRGDFDLASADFDRAIRLDPNR